MTEHLSDLVSIEKSYTVYQCHCEGDIEKVVTTGLPELPKGSMLEKMSYFRQHHDDIRQYFLHEPRGGMTHCVNFIVPSDNPKAEFGFIIGESEEYPLMSGGNTISVATVLLKSGMIPVTDPVMCFTLESPAGLIEIECDCSNDQIGRVKLVNQPAFVFCLDSVIDVPDFGKINVDVMAPGGKIYSTLPGNQYKAESGTSMASPAVAGVAALIRSYYPKLTAAQVKQVLMNSGLALPAKVIVGGDANDIQPFSDLTKSGKLVNAYNALIIAEQISKN